MGKFWFLKTVLRAKIDVVNFRTLLNNVINLFINQYLYNTFKTTLYITIPTHDESIFELSQKQQHKEIFTLNLQVKCFKFNI